MKVPAGKTVYQGGKVYRAGDDLPDDLAKKIEKPQKPKKPRTTDADKPTYKP